MTASPLSELEHTYLSAVVAAGTRGTSADAVCRPWVGVDDAAAFARLLALGLAQLERRESAFVYVATSQGLERSRSPRPLLVC
jgi:hypothetical protein